jgi:hypothetical protein
MASDQSACRRVIDGAKLELTDRVVGAPHTFDESVMFQAEMFDLKDDVKHRFRNMSRI